MSMGRFLDAFCRILNSHANNKKLLFCINIGIKIIFKTTSRGRVKGPEGPHSLHDVDDAALSKEFVTHTQDVIYKIK